MPLIPRQKSGRKETMKKVKVDIPLELYTDNVRKIIERSVYNPNLVPPHLSSLLCDPEITKKRFRDGIATFRKYRNRENKAKNNQSGTESQKRSS